VRNESLIIPPALLALAGVTASEKLLLALYAAEPKAKNRRALHVLGVGASGLKKIKLRLKTKGFLRTTAASYEVQVPGLNIEAEAGEGHLLMFA
jgi:hypothetical protein